MMSTFRYFYSPNLLPTCVITTDLTGILSKTFANTQQVNNITNDLPFIHSSESKMFDYLFFVKIQMSNCLS